MKLQKILFGFLLVVSLNGFAMDNNGFAMDNISSAIDDFEFDLIAPKDLPADSGFMSMATTTSTNSFPDLLKNVSFAASEGASESLPVITKGHPRDISSPQLERSLNALSAYTANNLRRSPVKPKFDEKGAAVVSESNKINFADLKGGKTSKDCWLESVWLHVVRQDYNAKYPQANLYFKVAPKCVSLITIASLREFARDLQYIDEDENFIEPVLDSLNQRIIRSSQDPRYAYKKRFLESLTKLGYSADKEISFDELHDRYEEFKAAEERERLA